MLGTRVFLTIEVIIKQIKNTLELADSAPHPPHASLCSPKTPMPFGVVLFQKRSRQAWGLCPPDSSS